MKILGIDPANEQSAYVVLNLGSRTKDSGRSTKTPPHIESKGKVDNKDLLFKLDGILDYDVMVIEMVQHMGMPAGASVFETAYWIGRFCQAIDPDGDGITPFYRIYRRDIKLHICESMRAKDSNIRRALIDRFEPTLPPRKKPRGFLKGLSKDMWQALAVAIYWADTNYKGWDKKKCMIP